jgi:hypothetical protein
MTNVSNFATSVSVLKSTTNTDVQYVTEQELNDVLASVTLSNAMPTFSNVLQLTAPKTTVKCRDTKEPFNGMIEKLSQVSILLNSDYEKAVTNKLTKENKPNEDYKRGQNTMPIEKCLNNNFYGTFQGKGVIEYRPNPNVKTMPKTKYFLNAVEVEKTSLPNVLPIVNKATNQGTTEEILWRKLYVSNIMAITINKKMYVRV